MQSHSLTCRLSIERAPIDTDEPDKDKVFFEVANRRFSLNKYELCVDQDSEREIFKVRDS